jgi:hypothetical protein
VDNEIDFTDQSVSFTGLYVNQLRQGQQHEQHPRTQTTTQIDKRQIILALPDFNNALKPHSYKTKALFIKQCCSYNLKIRQPL